MTNSVTQLNLIAIARLNEVLYELNASLEDGDNFQVHTHGISIPALSL